MELLTQLHTQPKPTKLEELFKAHEQYLGTQPSALEKYLYGWLGLGQIEKKLAEFADLEKLKAATH